VSFDLAAHDLKKLERSFWLNASLAAPKRGYWGAEFPEPKAPTAVEIANAARVLMQDANPTRLYLIHHHELPAERTMQLFRDWRKAVPAAVEIVPALVLRMYDKKLTPVFAEAELQSLITFFRAEIHPSRIAVYDVLPNRDQGSSLAILSQSYESGLIRVGLQPDEKLAPPFVAAVEDTWSGFCHGKTNDDWQEHGFGRDTLRRWVTARNAQPLPIAYDLIVVAWDYDNTKRGEYPGYDDAHKNMPLPAGRNRLAVDEILTHAKDGVLAGFSSDLLIVELNSETKEHDGSQTFYTMLKSGQSYTGYYSTPWREVCTLFKSLADGKR
jgi:hypothetical protein